MEKVEDFQTEKVTFDQEVAKWDEAGNDIIALAKYMGMIMLQMTDFIRFVIVIYLLTIVL